MSAARGRLRSPLTTLYGTDDIHRGRVTAIAADIERHGLGLPAIAAAQPPATESLSELPHRNQTLSVTAQASRGGGDAPPCSGGLL